MKDNHINCLQCGLEIPKGLDTCNHCGWSYELQSEDDLLVPDHSAPVCIKCLSEYEALESYCKNCGHVVGRFTEYQPFVNIRFSYSFHATLWERIWHDKDIKSGKKFFYLALLTLVAPVFILFIPVEVFRKILSK